MALSIGTTINNRYKIINILGQGGMGSVYEAEDSILNIRVAVKENLILSDEYTRQFEREAKILASSRHPSLPRVGDYFFISGQGQYLIMDFIEGEDLRERIDRLSSIPENDTILIGIAICDALTYLHSRTSSILHRDIKPGNIKITPDGDVFLVDFGLAKIVKGNQATTEGARAMTPGYSPPEQYGTARTDERSDIYSLGATLYAALTGVIPEDGLDRATGKTSLTPLKQLNPDISRRLASVIEKSLEIEPENRYQSANEFRHALIESANFTKNTWQKLRVTPPPHPDEDIDVEDFVFEKKEIKPKNKSGKSLVTSLVLILLLALAGSAFYFDFFQISSVYSPTIISYFLDPTSTQNPISDSSTPSQIPTETITATYQPTETLLAPTQTLAATEKPTITFTPSPTYTGGSQGSILFVSDRSGKIQIWLLDLETSIQSQVTNMDEGACQPSWSSDGTKIAFISPCSSKNIESYEFSKIFIMDADGGNIEELAVNSEEGDYDPVFSPDGTKIAFTSLRTGKAHIFSYDFENDILEELSDERFADFHPSWSPDGSQLVIVRNNVFNHIYILSEKGFTQFQFSSNGNINDYWPDWSSDGQFIIFERSSPDTIFPYLVRLSLDERFSGMEQRIPPLGSEFAAPIFEAELSPDDQWIVFESWPDGRNHDIFIMDINGENIQRLTTDPGNDFSPSWRPGFN